MIDQICSANQELPKTLWRPPTSLKSFLILAIILLATFLRLYHLDANSLWGDEINIVSNSTGFVPNKNGNAILYMPLLRIFIEVLGQNEFVVRLPAAFAGILAIPLIYKTGRLVFSREAGLVSAFLLSISVIHINYSQEAHSYALFAFLSLFSFFFLWSALQTNQWHYWLFFGLSVGLSIPTHFYTFFVLIGELLIIIVLLFFRRRPWSTGTSLRTVIDKKLVLNLSAAFGVIVLFILPLFLPYILPQLTRTRNITVTLSGSGNQLVPSVPARIRFEISPALFEQAARELVVWGYPHSDLILALFTGGLLAGLIYLLLKKTDLFLAALIWIIIPPLLIAAFALVSNNDYAARRLIFVLPITLIVMAIGITVISQFLHRLIGKVLEISLPVWGIILIFALGVFGGASFMPLKWYYNQYEKRDWKRAAALLEEFIQEGDMVIVHADKSYPAISHLGYYYSGSSDKLVFMPRNNLNVAAFEDKYQKHNRLWYVRKIIQQDNLLEIETWLRQNDFLTFAFGGEGVGLDYEGLYVSYHNKNATSEEQKLAEWQEILEQAFQLKPGRWYMYEALSDLYIRQREYEKAITLWHQYLTANPGDATAYLGLAKVYEASGQPDDAFAQIKEAIKTDPGDLRIYNTLGYVLRSRGGPEQALADIYQQLEAVDPAVAHFALALYYADASQHESAVREFQTVLELDPSRAVAAEARRWLSLYE